MIMDQKIKYRLLFAVSLTGIILSLFIGLVEHTTFLQSLCIDSSGSCKEITGFTLFHLPLWIWGATYYSLLTYCIYRQESKLTSYLVPGAIGFEFALTWIAISTETRCIFCLVNFLLVLLLAIISFQKRQVWQLSAVSSLVFLFSILVLPYENDLHAAFSLERGPKKIIAVAAGSSITAEELEEPIAARITEMEREIYRLKRQRLDEMIAKKVLQKEADERKIPLQQMINGSILLDVQVSDAEVDRFYEENSDRLAGWKGSEKELKNQIKASLMRDKSFQKVMDYAKSLYAKYAVAIYLEEPKFSYVNVDVQGEPFLGPQDAPLTIVEFSDYLCPACRENHKMVKEIREDYSGRVKWVFKDYPLKKHKEAVLAAEAARCAGDQGKFWEYQDILFTAQETPTPERLRDYAEKLGLEPGPFEECLSNGKYKTRVEQNLAEGKSAGISGTPSFVIAGKIISGGPSVAEFKERIDEELKNTGTSP